MRRFRCIDAVDCFLGRGPRDGKSRRSSAQTCTMPAVQSDMSRSACEATARQESPSMPTRRRRPAGLRPAADPRPKATCGRQATGRGTAMNTSGCPAHGSSRRSPACCGPRAIGRSSAASTPSIAAIGASTSASTAASITASATAAPATRAAIGTTADFSTIASVTNIGRVNIANVYSQPVAVREDQRVELQRRPERRGRQTDRRRARSGEGEAHRADAPTNSTTRASPAGPNPRSSPPTRASQASPRRRSPASSRGRGRSRQGRRRPAAAGGRDETAPGAANGPTPEPTKGKCREETRQTDSGADEGQVRRRSSSR